MLGRSAAALESYVQQLPGKDRVRVVCIDIASVYRALVKKYFPKARIVADAFMSSVSFRWPCVTRRGRSWYRQSCARAGARRAGHGESGA